MGVWILAGKKSELLYLLELAGAGILLGRSSIVSGWYMHDYHWEWFWGPVRLIVVLILLTDLTQKTIALPECPAWVFAAFLMLYVASGIYLLEIGVTRTSEGVAQLENYRRFAVQMLGPGAIRLVPGSVVAGDEEFANSLRSRKTNIRLPDGLCL